MVRLATFPVMIAIFAALTPDAAAQYVISTVAGTEWVFSSDGKLALNAPIARIDSLALDGQSNLLIADPDNNVVVRIDSTGILTVVAGNGIAGLSGDGGLAVNASLQQPEAVVADASGNLYIADAGNDRIRRVDTQGVITTFAGNGITGFSGDGGGAANAALSFPTDLRFDAFGSLYVVNTGNNRIRKINPNGTIGTVAGNGQQGCSAGSGPAVNNLVTAPSGLAFDSQGNLYYADFLCNWIKRIGPDGTVNTFAGNGQPVSSGDGGPAIAAGIYGPAGVALDNHGNLFISEANNCVIREISTNGIISTVAGTGGRCGIAGSDGPALNSTLFFPFGLAADASGNVYIADRGNERVRVLSPRGSLTTVAGNGKFRLNPDGTRAAEAYLFSPEGVAFDGVGNLYVTDRVNSLIRRISPAGQLATIAGLGPAGFGGDGGPATSALLSFPQGIAVTAGGTVYFADTNNNRIRKISSGIITTVAGRSGIPGSGGDGGPATQALLDTPSGVAVDGAGNIYFTENGNHVVRRVGLDGVISTIAGTGKPGYSGDNGRALSAALSYPNGITIDVAGNLLIVDSGNNRIRRITPDGTITTIAGNGALSLTGDGGPATTASLGAPTGVMTDLARNIYISEQDNNRVRKVGADGIITTIAGSGVRGFAGDGGSATAAALYAPDGMALDANGNLYVADAGNDRIRVVLANPPSYQISTSSLTFTAKSQGDISAAQNIALTPSLAGMPYLTSNLLSGGGQWLQVTPGSGKLPGTLQVNVDPTDLVPGTYQASLTITSPIAIPQVRTVGISLNVSAADPPTLRVDNKNISFAATIGASSSTASVNIRNSGGGTLAFTASVNTASGTGWLSISSESGTSTPSQPAIVTVTADPTGLAAGTYTGTITVSNTASSGSVVIPVNFAVTNAQKVIVLSRSGLTFTAVAEGGAVSSQGIAVLNAGQGAMNWTAQASILGRGPNWLAATPNSGTVQAPFTDLSSITVSVSAAGLAAGEYYGQVQISAAGADNSPEIVTVLLLVLPAGSNPGPDIEPSSLIFTGMPGQSPGSQILSISSPVAGILRYDSIRLTEDGGNWLVHVPTSATLSTTAPSRVVVQPDFTALQPGLKKGLLNFQFSDGSVRSVDVLSVVTGGSGVAGLIDVKSAAHDAGCNPVPLLPKVTSLSNGFSVARSQSTAVEAQVQNNCGAPVTDGPVTAIFDSGDSVKLVHAGSGKWTGSWQPQAAVGTPVRLVVRAFSGIGKQLIAGDSATLSGTVRSGSSTPVIFAGSILNGASFVSGGPVAPGGLISIFGSQLAVDSTQAPVPPWQTDLNGTEVLLGGHPLPLNYASDGQINAQVPYGVPVNTPHQLLVRRGDAQSVAEVVTIAPAQPAIFAQDQSGRGAGVILNAETSLPITPASPAQARDAVVIYCAGLGEVDPPVPSGEGAVGMSSTINPVTVTIGGQAADVSFAGLVAGVPGRYQVQTVVPSGVQPGDSVPVVISIAGQISPPVTMAIQ